MGGQTGRQADRPTDRQTDRQVDGQMDRQTDRQAQDMGYILANADRYRLTQADCRQKDRQTGR